MSARDDAMQYVGKDALLNISCTKLVDQLKTIQQTPSVLFQRQIGGTWQKNSIGPGIKLPKHAAKALELFKDHFDPSLYPNIKPGILD